MLMTKDSLLEIPEADATTIEIEPIGVVKRISSDEDVRDRSLVSKIVLKKDLNKALDGIEDFSHIYVIYWLHTVRGERPLQFGEPSIGVFATRAPIHPNPVGLTLVELVTRKANVLWVRGLDAYDGTPVIDIKPYPDWEHGHLIVVTDFRIPHWLQKLLW
jgi:tRNA-Thr(GGU) m(6)t(6)A37 methyltransferase TsaA